MSLRHPVRMRRAICSQYNKYTYEWSVLFLVNITHIRVVQCVAACCSVLRCVAAYWSVLQYTYEWGVLLVVNITHIRTNDSVLPSHLLPAVVMSYTCTRMNPVICSKYHTCTYDWGISSVVNITYIYKRFSASIPPPPSCRNVTHMHTNKSYHL